MNTAQAVGTNHWMMVMMVVMAMMMMVMAMMMVVIVRDWVEQMNTAQ